MTNQDIRWLQRLSNYKKALAQLTDAVELANQKALSKLEKLGLIQAFEFTYELAWNVMKDYAHFQGNSEVAGSRDATREGFALNLITDGTMWMEMIKSRNQTSHAYDEEIANEIAERIIKIYCPLFTAFRDQMEYKTAAQKSETL